METASEKSTTSRAWKQAIYGQIAAQAGGAHSDRPVQIERAFPGRGWRNWANLCKPTIDCLGPIVGAGRRRLAPRNDLLTRLGLHQTVDEALGNRVELGIWWRAGD